MEGGRGAVCPSSGDEFNGLGKQYPLTLINMHNLAATYENQGRWEEAEKLLI